MVGKWLGCIQPMCSAPGAFPPGAFFRQKSAPFCKKCLFVCFYDKTFLFIIKRPDTGGFARLRAYDAEIGLTWSYHRKLNTSGNS